MTASNEALIVTMQTHRVQPLSDTIARKPLTMDNLDEYLYEVNRKDGLTERIEVCIEVSLSEIIELDLDEFNDHIEDKILSKELQGDYYLEDIGYRICGFDSEDNTVFLEVDAEIVVYTLELEGDEEVGGFLPEPKVETLEPAAT